MREFEKLTGLVRDKVRNADADKLSHMRQVLSHAYQEISEE
jgi:hypothetical protein